MTISAFVRTTMPTAGRWPRSSICSQGGSSGRRYTSCRTKSAVSGPQSRRCRLSWQKENAATASSNSDPRRLASAYTAQFARAGAPRSTKALSASSFKASCPSSQRLSPTSSLLPYQKLHLPKPEPTSLSARLFPGHVNRSFSTSSTCSQIGSSSAPSPTNIEAQGEGSSSTKVRGAMTATKIDGTAVAKRIREGLKATIAEKKQINPRYQPSLKIIQGD
ncbi:hypothetical protein V8F20_005744 [Naviculisporaceae sp. PSN 640]